MTLALSEYLESPLDKLRECIDIFKRDYLRGFFDAEGYVTCSANVGSMRIDGVHIGVANTRIDYLNVANELLAELGIQGRFRTTNKKGGKMTIRGKTWTRRHDVHHLASYRFEDVRRFHKLVGFRNSTKAEKLRDLIKFMGMPPRERYHWFVSRYRKDGRKWVRIRI